MPNSYFADNPYHQAVNAIDPEHFQECLDWIDACEGMNNLLAMTHINIPGLMDVTGYILTEQSRALNEFGIRIEQASRAFEWRTPVSEIAVQDQASPSEQQYFVFDSRQDPTEAPAPREANDAATGLPVSMDFSAGSSDVDYTEEYVYLDTEDFPEEAAGHLEGYLPYPDISSMVGWLVTAGSLAYTSMNKQFYQHP